MKYSAAEENSSNAKYNITVILVDSRKDNTLIIQHDEITGTVRKRILNKSHTTMIEKPKSYSLYTKIQN